MTESMDMSNFHLLKKGNRHDKSTDVKSHASIPHGEIETKKYKDYYDVATTITTAGSTNPNDPNSNVYNIEPIFRDKERYAERLLVKNDGADTLFLIISHGGSLNLSAEVPLYAGESKVYYNVFELRLRSPTSGNPYRVMEYELDPGTNSGVTQEPVMPTDSVIIQGTVTGIDNVPAPIVAASTPIYKVVVARVRSLGTGTYIALGSATGQPFRLTTIGASMDIDWTDNLNKVYRVTDAGNTGILEYLGA